MIVDPAYNFRSAALLSAILAMILVACGPPDGGVTNNVTVRDSSGVWIVENRAPSWTPATQWSIDTVPITTIGRDESDPKQQLPSVTLARRLSDGRVVLFASNELRLYESSGKFQKTVAPAGDGPGEFRSLSSLFVMPGDTIVAATTQKAAYYTPDGSLHSEKRFCDGQQGAPLVEGVRTITQCGTQLLPDGSAVLIRADSSIPRTATNRPSYTLPNGMTTPGPGLLRQLRRAFVIPSSLDALYPTGIMAGIEQFGIDMGEGRHTFIIHPFYSFQSLLAAGGDPLTVAIATNPDYRIEIWTPRGKLERVISRADGRRIPTEAEKATAREQLARMEPEIPIDRILAAITVPDSLPAVQGLLVAPGGEIFVQRQGIISGELQIVQDVFRNTGHWLGELVLPPRTRILEVGRDYVLWRRLNDDDVPRIEIVPLRKPPG